MLTHYSPEKLSGLRSWWTLWMVMLLCLSACSLTTQIPSTTADNVAEPAPERRWLQKVPCAAPCWEGITPGRSTLTETLGLLAHNPAVKGIELVPVPLMRYRRDTGGVSWAWRWAITDTVQPAALYDTLSVTQPVYALEVYFQGGVTLQEVINAYGAPSHVLLGLSRASQWLGAEVDRTLALVYLDHGLALLHSPPSQTSPIPLGVALDLYAGKFFVPSLSGLARAMNMEEALVRSALVPWQGMHDMKHYCRQAVDPDFGSCQ